MITVKEKKYLRLDSNNIDLAKQIKDAIKTAAKDGRKFISVNMEMEIPMDVFFELFDQFGYEHFQSYGKIGVFKRVAPGPMNTVGFCVPQDTGNMDE
jgi:hypothetical protein